MRDFTISLNISVMPIDQRGVSDLVDKVYIDNTDIPDVLIHELMLICEQKLKQKEEGK
jgi:hypothetical protein|tara:strand:- start:184 stop:357 length:174 start_codon:yes stop_codon:yes gene_type:complete